VLSRLLAGESPDSRDTLFDLVQVQSKAMTVLSRGARARRGGRRPGWVLLTALLVLAMGASSGLVFTNRVELLKLAVILALWAAVAGAFASVLYRRQSDADQSRVRDLKLVYDLQLDREISARREYELTVESQLRRELASELRAQAADDVAALRAELASLRTSLEILFDTDLEHRRALERPQTLETDTPGYIDWGRTGESQPMDWVASDRVTAVHQDSAAGGPDEASIIDVPEEPLVPPRPAAPRRERERVTMQYEATPPPPPPPAEPRFEPPPPPPEPEPQLQPQPDWQPAAADWRPPPPQPEPQLQPPPDWQPAAADWRPPPPQPEPQLQPPPEPQLQPQPDWQPAAAEGHWLPPGAPGSNWAGFDDAAAPPAAPSGRRRRARHSSPEEMAGGAPAPAEPVRSSGESGRRARSRHSAEFRDFGAGGLGGPAGAGGLGMSEPPPPMAAARPPGPAAPPPPPSAAPPPPRLAPAPPPELAPRHRGTDPLVEEEDDSAPQTGGQSVADLFARLQVDPGGGGGRRRRSG
jgi:hypothetical protein